MSYKLFLQFDLLPKSLNKKLTSHWRVLHKENNQWDLMVKMKTQGKLPPKPLERVQITIVRHSWKFLDYDNLVASMKCVVDSLVSSGVMVSDSYKVTGPWIVLQKFRSKSEGPLLEVMLQGKPTEKS